MQDSFQQGVDAFQSQRYEQAIAAFTQAIRQNPNRAAAYGNRCLAYLKLNQNSLAIADCTQALERDFSNAEFYLNRGLANYRLGLYTAAIDNYNQVLSLKPDDYRAFYNRGLAEFGLAHYSAAIADYNRSLQRTPQLSAARMAAIYDDRGAAYLLIQKPAAAVRDFLQAINYDASDSSAFFNLACACHQQGYELAAIEYFSQVLGMDSHQAQTYLNRGLIYSQIGKKQQAIADLHQAAHYLQQQGSQAAYQQVTRILHQLQTEPSVFG
ncbi:tetratricopeptide repeat protein [Almyronema epifaneia]|uniref:Tetratricopeptide repeat protein n=1 Tax=Almyronema epifaneia S1 TaxID=2991925 RepID=A0ABW6IF48_9CYAN